VTVSVAMGWFSFRQRLRVGPLIAFAGDRGEDAGGRDRLPSHPVRRVNRSSLDLSNSYKTMIYIACGDFHMVQGSPSGRRRSGAAFAQAGRTGMPLELRHPLEPCSRSGTRDRFTRPPDRAPHGAQSNSLPTGSRPAGGGAGRHPFSRGEGGERVLSSSPLLLADRVRVVVIERARHVPRELEDLRTDLSCARGSRPVTPRSERRHDQSRWLVPRSSPPVAQGRRRLVRGSRAGLPRATRSEVAERELSQAVVTEPVIEYAASRAPASTRISSVSCRALRLPDETPVPISALAAESM